MKLETTKLKKLATLLGVKFIEDFRSNGFGGTSNGNTILKVGYAYVKNSEGKYVKDESTAYPELVCTCGNCGQGMGEDLTKIYKLI